MSEAPRRGDHPYIDARLDEHADEDRLPREVFAAELADINARRRRNNRTEYDLGSCQPTGVALSGGGIRSASFCLGALQGLESQTKTGIEGVDYLSTVSGGGYVGCALTAATQKLNGQFPFTSSDPKVYADTPSVRHIRDYSNYLIPHGAGDVITALVIAARGLAANALIVLPILLFFVGLTLFIHPDAVSLEQPFAGWGVSGGPPLWGLHGFWLTAILASRRHPFSFHLGDRQVGCGDGFLADQGRPESGRRAQRRTERRPRHLFQAPIRNNVGKSVVRDSAVHP